MISLITGLPRNGKTLRFITMVKKLSEEQGRPVFYSGIPGVTIPGWTEIDPKKWMDCPDGAIIAIDEAQDTFPKMPNGSRLPDYYEMLAKHGHKGFDMFFLTQHPSFLDNFVRKLVNQHFHVIRKFGLQRATVYEWDRVAEFPERLSSQKISLSSSTFRYPKEAFGWYKSASVHNVKRRVPLKLVFAILGVVLFASYAVYSFSHMSKPRPGAVAGAAVSSSDSSLPAAAAGASGVPFDAMADARRFAQMSTPRIAGLPQTAPKYDELTKPVRVPIPAACIQRGDIRKGEASCKCLTQQGTPMDVPFNMCIEFARNGFFQDFNAEKDAGADVKMARSTAALETSPVGSPDLVDRGRVLVFADASHAPSPSSSSSRAPTRGDVGDTSGAQRR